MNNKNLLILIEKKIQNLQLYMLTKYLECMMFKKYGANWKYKVIDVAREKYKNNDHKSNYKSIISAVGIGSRNNEELFNIEQLDLTSTLTLIKFDFLEICCVSKEKKDFYSCIVEITNDRNKFAHYNKNEDQYRNCLDSIENIEKFIKILENNNWEYEYSQQFRDYLLYIGRDFDKKSSFIEEIKKNIINYKAELTQIVRFQKNNITKFVTIAFVNEYKEKLDGISCLVKSEFDSNYMFTCRTVDKKIYLPLLIGRYEIICLDVPTGYRKFFSQKIYIKATDNSELYMEIKLKRDIDIEESLEHKDIKLIFSVIDTENRIISNVKIKIYTKNNFAYSNIFMTKNEVINLTLSEGEYYFERIQCPEEYIPFQKKEVYLFNNNITKKINIKIKKRAEIIKNNNLKHCDVLKTKVIFSIKDKNNNFIEGCKVNIITNNKKIIKKFVTRKTEFKYSLFNGIYQIELLDIPKGYLKPKMDPLIIKNSDNNSIIYNIVLASKQQNNVYISIVDNNDEFINDLQVQLFNSINKIKPFFSWITKNNKMALALKEGEYTLKIISPELEAKNKEFKFEIIDTLKQKEILWKVRVTNREKKHMEINDIQNSNKKQYYNQMQMIKINQKNSHGIINNSENYYQKGYNFYVGENERIDYIEAAENFKKAAILGHIEAQYYLACLCFNGTGVEKNESQAFYWFKQAAMNGHIESQEKIGYLYNLGIGVEKNDTLAVYWYKKAAEHDCAKAQYAMYLFMLNGSGIKQDKKQAFNWLVKSAENGYVYAQTSLASEYVFGELVEEDINMAIQWYRKAAEQGDLEGEVMLAYYLMNFLGNEDNISEAILWYEKAAQKKNKIALYELAKAYENGVCLPVNKIKAFELYQEASELGHVEAQNMLGICYLNGNGVKKNLEKAFQMFEKAAENGNSESEYYLGVFFYKGYYVKSDLGKAIKYYKKASESGEPKAQSALGYCYYIGYGVEKNLEMAYNLFLDAAKKGEVIALRNLGVFYELGINVEQDYNKALDCYFKAAENGDRKAKEYLDSLNQKNEIETKDDDKLPYSLIQKNISDVIQQYKLEAENGNSEAQYNLGTCYENGEGVNKNLIEAACWYRKAAKNKLVKARKSLQKLITEYPSLSDENEPVCVADYICSFKFSNDPIYQYRIGLAYEHGIDVKKDIVKAYEWYKKAAKRDFELAKEACNRLSEDYPDEIKKEKSLLSMIFNK